LTTTFTDLFSLWYLAGIQVAGASSLNPANLGHTLIMNAYIHSKNCALYAKMCCITPKWCHAVCNAHFIFSTVLLLQMMQRIYHNNVTFTPFNTIFGHSAFIETCTVCSIIRIYLLQVKFPTLRWKFNLIY